MIGGAGPAGSSDMLKVLEVGYLDVEAQELEALRLKAWEPLAALKLEAPWLEAWELEAPWLVAWEAEAPTVKVRELEAPWLKVRELEVRARDTRGPSEAKSCLDCQKQSRQYRVFSQLKSQKILAGRTVAFTINKHGKLQKHPRSG